MTDKSYVGRAMDSLKKHGNSLYLGGAGASAIAGIPFAKKYANVFAGLDWTSLTKYVQWPFAVLGAGQLGQVLEAHDRDKAEGVKPHALEYVGRAMRPAPLLAPLIAYFTNDNALSLVIPGMSTTFGYLAENVGASLRKRKEKK